MPFRVGTTSYIYPDEVLPNVQRLAGRVDDVEIVLFEVSSRCALPDCAVVDALRRLGEVHDLTYTVHLPLDLALAAGDGDTREQAVARARYIMADLARLEPWGWVLHVEHGGRRPGSWMEWRRLAVASLRCLAEGMDDPVRLCLENVETVPPEATFELAESLGVGVCLDIGHLFKVGIDPVAHLEREWPRTRVVHLHGWDGERDHRSLAVMDAVCLAPVVARLYDLPYRGVVTLEVFNEHDLHTSWRVLTGWSPADSEFGEER